MYKFNVKTFKGILFSTGFQYNKCISSINRSDGQVLSCE